MGMSSMNPYKRQGTGTWESGALRNRGKSVKARSYRGVYFITVLSALPRNQYKAHVMPPRELNDFPRWAAMDTVHPG